jgi:hypothetical protein
MTKKEDNKEKLSYEQLEEVTRQLTSQYKQLYNRFQEVNFANAFKRLDYLFKVVELYDHFNSDFVVSCTQEIENTLTLPENNNNESNADK